MSAPAGGDMAAADDAAAAAAPPGGAAPPAAPAPTTPAPIVQLPEAVVHRIAAGEVIQRPASALKEMLENSIDAGATRVSVTVKEGGLRLLQVADDGCGIARRDLPLLCVRHATSKLRAYEDLETIATLGFRGEALASISFVAHLSVTTMARGAPHGWKASYGDGALLDPPGAKPCAAVPGTVLTVEDLFYNVPARRKAFRPGGSEEGALILDLLQRYAIWAAPRVGFSLRRQGESRADLATSPGASRLDVIRQIHGPDLAAALLPLRVVRGEEPGPHIPHDAPGGPHVRVDGFVTSLSWAGRRGTLVLFINGRCVECGPLKRGAEAVYATLVPRAPKPWMFLDVRLPPRQVEVNVHPTKREVGFLNQDEVIDAVCRELEATLLAAMSSRTFATEAGPSAAATSLRLAEQVAKAAAASGGSVGRTGSGVAAARSRSGEGAASQQQQQQGGSASQPRGGSQQPPAYRPDKLVRADHRMRTMDAFVVRGAPAGTAGSSGGGSSATQRAGASGKDGASRDQQQQQQEEDEEGGEPAVGVAASAAARAAVGGGGVPRKRRAAERDRLTFNSNIAAAALAAGDPEGEEAEMRDVGAQEGGAGGNAATDPSAKPPLPMGRSVKQRPNPPGPPPVPAARALLAEREASPHEGLAALLSQHVFVGLADDRGEWALLQHGTRLYLLAAGPLSRDLFEQQLLRRWGRCPAVALGEPLGLEELAAAGMEVEVAEGRWKPEHGAPAEIASLTARLLSDRAPLLAQAGLIVDASARLASVPLLIDGYTPDPSRLPALVLALARDVDWEGGDDAAVAGVAAAVAAFYALAPLPAAGTTAAAAGGSREEHGSGGSGGEAMDVDPSPAAPGETPATAQPQAAGPHHSLADREWTARHVLFPSMRSLLRPLPCRARDGSCLLLTSMERLYRVFERCG